mgnify:CR=1 FL=1
MIKHFWWALDKIILPFYGVFGISGSELTTGHGRMRFINYFGLITPMISTKQGGEIMTRKVIKDNPLAELILRKYEMPYETDERELLKKFCLGVGLLQPGDSRDIVVDVFNVLLEARTRKEMLDSEHIRKLVIEKRQNENLPILGVASSNIRRQLKRLRDLGFAEKVKNNYRITEFASLEKTFEERIENFILPSIIARVKEYFRMIDKKFV